MPPSHTFAGPQHASDTLQSQAGTRAPPIDEHFQGLQPPGLVRLRFCPLGWTDRIYNQTGCDMPRTCIATSFQSVPSSSVIIFPEYQRLLLSHFHHKSVTLASQDHPWSVQMPCLYPGAAMAQLLRSNAQDSTCHVITHLRCRLSSSSSPAYLCTCLG